MKTNLYQFFYMQKKQNFNSHSVTQRKQFSFLQKIVVKINNEIKTWWNLFSPPRKFVTPTRYLWCRKMENPLTEIYYSTIRNLHYQLWTDAFHTTLGLKLYRARRHLEGNDLSDFSFRDKIQKNIGVLGNTFFRTKHPWRRTAPKFQEKQIRSENQTKYF